MLSRLPPGDPAKMQRGLGRRCGPPKGLFALSPSSAEHWSQWRRRCTAERERGNVQRALGRRFEVEPVTCAPCLSSPCPQGEGKGEGSVPATNQWPALTPTLSLRT